MFKFRAVTTAIKFSGVVVNAAVWLAVGDDVGVRVGVSLGMAVSVAVSVAVCVGVAVLVDVRVAVFVGISATAVLVCAPMAVCEALTAASSVPCTSLRVGPDGSSVLVAEGTSSAMRVGSGSLVV
jgi:hypothetical protein